MAGGLAALSDVPKTLVWRLARWINDDPGSPLRRRFGGPVIPANSIEKPPSAELAADQVDADSLPPYAVLDEIIERYVVLQEPPEQIARAIEAFEEQEARRIVAEVVRLIDRNEYKRKQTPPGLKVTSRAFGSGRRMPIAQGYAGAASLTASAARS
jgi:NH3-dependent NAD+ synthetase